MSNRLRSRPSTWNSRALHPGPYPPDLSRCHAYGAFNTGFSRIPSDLARRTQPVWQYQAVSALSALLPILPGTSRIGLRSAPTKLLRQPGGRTHTSLVHRQIPAHRQSDHLRREPEPGEARPRRCHPRVATTHQHSLPEPATSERNSAPAHTAPTPTSDAETVCRAQGLGVIAQRGAVQVPGAFEERPGRGWFSPDLQI
jgi:hypothetical protein